MGFYYKFKVNNMKGISEIIAIILILMIVIALAALAYTWFSGMFQPMTGCMNCTTQVYVEEWGCVEWNGLIIGCSIQTIDSSFSDRNINTTDLLTCANTLNVPKICWTEDWGFNDIHFYCTDVRVEWARDCSKFIWTKKLVG